MYPIAWVLIVVSVFVVFTVTTCPGRGGGSSRLTLTGITSCGSSSAITIKPIMVVAMKTVKIISKLFIVSDSPFLKVEK